MPYPPTGPGPPQVKCYTPPAGKADQNADHALNTNEQKRAIYYPAAHAWTSGLWNWTADPERNATENYSSADK